MGWKAMNRKELNQRVKQALSQNKNYREGKVIGAPGTYLDEEEFYPDASFLEDAPFLQTLIANPNHIGCHTLNKKSSPTFKGTQAIEKELIDLCAQQIFKAKAGQIDGYVATGGTEANLEALWIYRNYFRDEYRASSDQIGVLFSEDTHYSITKGCDLLQMKPLVLAVNESNRQIQKEALQKQLHQAQINGIRYFILIANVSTTLFGSVDELDPLINCLDESSLVFKVHIDAAFGGFIYPFTNRESKHHFGNPRISSISIDGHKMLQTPYGTGVFLIRKGLMQYVANQEAQYVPGLDYTLCGSRSGANAVVIWMLLMNYGFKGWTDKMNQLIRRTDFLCEALDNMGISYYRNPHLNIVSMRSNQIPVGLAKKYDLVADSYERPAQWWKIVVMEHVNNKVLKAFLSELKIKQLKML